MHATATCAREVPASAGRADPRHLRRRRTRDRRAVRSAHLRRIEPIRRADQEPRPRDGLCRRWRRSYVSSDLDVALEILLEGRIFGAAEAKEKRLVTRVVRRRRGRSAKRWRPRSASPRARRWSRAGTRSSRAASPIRGRSRRPSSDECFDCFDTEDFRIGYAAFLAKRKPSFVGRMSAGGRER